MGVFCDSKVLSAFYPWLEKELLAEFLVLLEGNSPITSGFPSQRVTNADF